MRHFNLPKSYCRKFLFLFILIDLKLITVCMIAWAPYRKGESNLLKKRLFFCLFAWLAGEGVIICFVLRFRVQKDLLPFLSVIHDDDRKELMCSLRTSPPSWETLSEKKVLLHQAGTGIVSCVASILGFLGVGEDDERTQTACLGCFLSWLMVDTYRYQCTQSEN